MDRIVFAIIVLAVGCSKPLNKNTETNVEQAPIAAQLLGVPDTGWYNKNHEDSVFTISTADELAGLSQIVNGTWGGEPARDAFLGKTIRLAANIDLSGYENWVPIGNYGSNKFSIFSGTFDGGGHVISKVNIDRLNSLVRLIREGKPTVDSDFNYRNNYLGLFGCIVRGRVENLGLDGVNIRGGNYAGGIAGRISGNSIIVNSYSIGKVKGIDNVGGVAGAVDMNSSVSNSYSTGKVEGDEVNVGGIAGLVNMNSSVSNSYSTSQVIGFNGIGGVAGVVSGNSSVTNCVALNLALTSMQTSMRTNASVGRVAGLLQNAVLSNNAAHTGIENHNGYTHWPIDNGADAKNGADITAAELLADGTLGGRFKDGWTTKNGYLPGLRGEALAFLTHLHKEAQMEMFDTHWYAANPKATNFTISAASELAGLAEIVNGTWGGNPKEDNFKGKTITLAGNIDLSRYHNWVPIGYSPSYNYSGTFDGGGHVISKLTINNHRAYPYFGLFGCIAGGNVKNLGLEEVSINGNYNNYNVDYSAGAVVGKIGNGSIANSYSTGTLDFSNAARYYYGNIGGIAGNVVNSSVINSYSTATVIGDYYVGGIAGTVHEGSVVNSYSTGAVSGNYYVGGLTGIVTSKGSVVNSYSTSAVSGKSSVGGIAGKIKLGGRVANCSALNPDVKSGDKKKDFAGRVVGVNGEIGNNKIYNSYGSISNNVAYAGMKNRLGNTDWLYKGTDDLDGADITAKEIRPDGSLGGGKFSAENGWTIEEGKLPGLGGKAVEMPEHFF